MPSPLRIYQRSYMVCRKRKIRRERECVRVSLCAHLSASRVIVQEGGDIVNFPVHCYPRILGGAVSCHILVAKLPVTQVQVVGGVIQRGHARMRAGERALDGEHHARTHTRTNARTRGGEDENERERARESARERD